MSDEYISREAVLIVLDWDCASQYALDAIKAIPAADVTPVRHGRWHDVYMSGASSFVGTCSVCGKSNDIPPVPLAKYCPSCGAKMDGGQE